MATTTTMTAICNSIEVMLAALTPAGSDGTAVTGGIRGHRAFAYVEDNYFKGDPSEMPEGMLDRRFVIESVIPQQLEIQGGLTESVWVDEMVIAIAHQWTNERAGRNRMEKDLHQIVAQVTKESNRPAGVHVIRFAGSSTQKILDGLFFWTELKFSVQYMMLANYGG